MTKFNSTHKFTAAAAFGAAALFSMLSFGGTAEAAKSVASCHGTSAGQIISCCKHIVEERGRPYWMIQSVGGCRELNAFVKCQGTYGPNRCYVLLYLGENGVDGGKNNKDHSPSRQK